ncbi:MAG: biopolymer transport protein ExbB [Myxococcota bacterium]|jgi:biopolymer transport protein ExbB
MSLLDFLEKGGYLMYPLGLCFLVAAAIYFERLWALASIRVRPSGFVQMLLRFIHSGDYEKAETACVQSQSTFALIAFAALRHRSLGRTELKHVTDEKGSLEIARLERGIGVVGTMASIAPLLGLLGTVTGMIQVFRKIAEETDPQIDVLAGGIWEALVSTGAGLTVAIPCYIAYRHLLSRVDNAAMQLEETTIEVIDALSEPGAPRSLGYDD